MHIYVIKPRVICTPAMMHALYGLHIAFFLLLPSGQLCASPRYQQVPVTSRNTHSRSAEKARDPGNGLAELQRQSARVLPKRKVANTHMHYTAHTTI